MKHLFNFLIAMLMAGSSIAQSIEVCKTCPISSLKDGIAQAKDFDTILVKVGPCPEPPPAPEPGLIDQPLEPAPISPDPKPVIIPNVMTPNGDEQNDLFVIQNLMDWQYRELIVMNRWGQVVYYNNDYKNNWDGNNLADGVYFGVLNISYKDIIEEYSFDVTILHN